MAGAKSEYRKADYDGPGVPSKRPIEVVLRVTGSQGGAYKVWQYTEEKSDFVDALDRDIYHTDKPRFRGVIGSEPAEYRFDMGDGVYRDATGDVQWDIIWVDIEKAKRQGRDWEGEIYAELLVNGKVVACRGTAEPFDGITFEWSL
jgi:hypothetical protein